MCVCGDRKTKQCFGWKEREECARENQPSDLCRLWAPPKSEKIEYWDVGHGFEILEPNKNFQFWVLSEIEFWEMSDVFELCVSSYKFWVLRYFQSKHPLNLSLFDRPSLPFTLFSFLFISTQIQTLLFHTPSLSHQHLHSSSPPPSFSGEVYWKTP